MREAPDADDALMAERPLCACGKRLRRQNCGCCWLSDEDREDSCPLTGKDHEPRGD
jgi:hypothetical protein